MVALAKWSEGGLPFSDLADMQIHQLELIADEAQKIDKRTSKAIKKTAKT